MADRTWRTSSYSDKINCVEVALTLGDAWVRDSKDRAGGKIALSAGQWRRFVHAVRAERFGV